jgi:hypothetical protein
LTVAGSKLVATKIFARFKTFCFDLMNT